MPHGREVNPHISADPLAAVQQVETFGRGRRPIRAVLRAIAAIAEAYTTQLRVFKQLLAGQPTSPFPGQDLRGLPQIFAPYFAERFGLRRKVLGWTVP